MEMRLLKTKITKALRKNGFHKVQMARTRIKGSYRILYSGFYYTGNEIRWATSLGTSRATGVDQILKIYNCLIDNGFSDFIQYENVGLGDVPVISLHLATEELVK